MKDFRSLIKDAVNNRNRRRRQLSAVVSLSVLVSFAVPMVLTEPASSMTFADIPADVISAQLMNASAYDISNMNGGNNGNGGYSKGTLTQGDLLIGKGSELYADSATDVIAKARKKYFLGIASDFCVFLENNFTPKAADTEGRVAVGGDIKTSADYQIGAGDFGNDKVLDQTTNYEGVTNFAHIIMGGSTLTGVAPFGTKDFGSKMIAAHGTTEEKEQNAFKRFVVPSSFDLSGTSHNADSGSNAVYDNNCTHWGTAGNGATLDEKSQFYNTDNVIDFNDEFEYMRSQSQKLSGITGKSVKEETTKDSLNQDVRTIVFDAGAGCTDKVVYFTIDADEIGSFDNLKFDFRNIPTFEGTVQSEIDEDKDLTPWQVNNNGVGKSFPEIANIVINVKGTNIEIGRTSNLIKTFVNGIEISNLGYITNGDERWSNNHPYSENILYNFYEADNVYVSANFNGTILAPNADVTSADGCEGHLSGALVAKSFEGGLEFGYRPYRGPASIISSSSGYGVPIRKVISGTDTGLEGATFDIFVDNKRVDSFTSDENGNGYANIPSAVDFSKDDYAEDDTESKKYEIRETDAPIGFILDDSKQYVVDVTETIKKISTIDGRNIPTEVETVMTSKTQTKDDEGNWEDIPNTSETFTIYLKDIYSYDASKSSSTRVRRELTIRQYGTAEETFYMDIDGDGKVIEVMQASGVTTAPKIAYSTGTTYVTNIETDYDTEVPVYVSVDEAGETVTTFSEEEGFTVQTTQKEITLRENLPEYTFNLIQAEGISDFGCEVTFYYNGDKEPLNLNSNALDDKGNLILKKNDNEDLSEDDKKGIVGITLKFNKDVNPSKFVIQSVEDWANIFGTEWNKNKHGEFKADTVAEFYTNGNVSPLNTTTSITVSASTVTTVITTHDKNYPTVTFDVDDIELPCYNTLSLNGNNTTYTTAVREYKYDEENIMFMPMSSKAPTFENEYGLIFKKVDDSKPVAEPVKGAVIDVQKYEFTLGGENWATVRENILGGDSSKTINLDGIDEVFGYNIPVYRFVETGTPSGFKKADYIYFVKDGNHIYYQQRKEEESFTIPYTDWERINLEENATDDPKFIEMIDKKIGGAEIKLEKWDSEFKTQLGGATFRLHASNGDLIYPLSGEFTIKADTPFDLYTTLKSADESKYDSKYVQNGYLKPGSYYLEEVDAPNNYDVQEKFGFRVKNDYSIVAIDANAPLYFTTNVGIGKEVWIYPQNAKDERISVSNVTKIEIELNNPTSGTLEIWEGPLHGTKSTITDGKVVLDNLNVASLESFKLQNEDYDVGVNVKEVKIYGEEGDGSGGSSENGTGLTIGMNGNNGTVTVSGALLAKAKEDPSKEFIELGKSGEGQIHILTNSVTNIDSGQIADSVGKTKYSLNDILSLAKSYNNGNVKNISSVNDITTIRFMEWTNGAALTGTALLEIDETPAEPETPETPEETEDLTVVVLGDTIKIPNKKSEKITITVEKKWVNDTGFESLRPESIEVQLQRKKSDDSEDTEFNSDDTYKATLDSSNKWKYSWSDLAIETTESENSSYTYYVKEITTDDNYVVSYDADDDGEQDTLTEGGTLTITNTLNTIDINVTKTWKDKNNEEITKENNNSLPEIEVQVEYRPVNSKVESDWTEYSKKIILSIDNNWETTVENLPEAYEYRFTEVSLPVSWECESITQTKDAAGNINVSIVNKANGIELPSAGGKGTTNYYIFGVLIMSMSGVFLLIRRRKTAK